MKILHISDLHCNNKYKSIIDNINISNMDIDVIVCCGDILNRGQNIEQEDCSVLIALKSKLQNITSNIFICPGNHDICLDQEDSLGNFSEISQEYFSSTDDFSAKSTYVHTVKGYNFIITNSSFHKNHEYGMLDYETIKKELDTVEKSNENILVFHHSLFSCDENDGSSLRDMPSLLRLVNEYNIKTILHGHTHSYNFTTLDGKCAVIGVGPFLEPSENVNSQYNIIELYGGKIFTLDHYIYQKESNYFHRIEATCSSNFTHFETDSLTQMIEQVQKVFSEKNHLNNCIFSIKNTFKALEADLEQNFAPILQEAKDWQAPACPNSLWFNHGEKIDKFFDTFGTEIQKKSTTSRSIMSLVDMNDLIDKKDYIPSFSIIQAGFTAATSTTLNINLYMRAVEVCKFLPINICEIYLIISKLKELYIQYIEHVSINIISFRAQSIPDYDCFKKSDLDRLGEAELTSLLYKKNITKIIKILKAKSNTKESITRLIGVKNLYEAYKAYTGNSTNKDFEALIESLHTLEKYQQRHTLEEEISKQRKCVKEAFQAVINIFENLPEEVK